MQGTLGSSTTVPLFAFVCFVIATTSAFLIEDDTVRDPVRWALAQPQLALVLHVPCTPSSTSSGSDGVAASHVVCLTIAANATQLLPSVELSMVLTPTRNTDGFDPATIVETPMQWYSGTVVALPESVVRVCRRPDGRFQGSIHTSQGVIVVATAAEGQQTIARPEGWLPKPERRSLNDDSVLTEHDSRRSRRAPTDNVCAVYLDADVSFLNTWGGTGTLEQRIQRAQEVMLDVFFQAEGILALEGNLKGTVNFRIAGLSVHTTDYFATINQIEREQRPDAMLDFYQLLLAQDTLERDDDVAFDEACLNYLFTFEDLNSVLGVAIQAERGKAGGVCEDRVTSNNRVLNVGYLNTRSTSGEAISLWKAATNLAHEFGHSLGAAHDCLLQPGFTTSCSNIEGRSACVPSESQGGRYLMYPSTSVNQDQANGRFLSPCSLSDIADVLDVNRRTACFETVEDVDTSQAGTCTMRPLSGSPCSQPCGGGDKDELFACVCDSGFVDASGAMCGRSLGYGVVQEQCADTPCVGEDSRLVHVTVPRQGSAFPDPSALTAGFRQALLVPVVDQASKVSGSSTELFLQACKTTGRDCLSAQDLAQLLDDPDVRASIADDFGDGTEAYTVEVVDGIDDDDTPLWLIVVFVAAGLCGVFLLMLLFKCLTRRKPKDGSGAAPPRSLAQPERGSDVFVMSGNGAVPAATAGQTTRFVANDTFMHTDPMYLTFNKGQTINVWTTETHLGPEWWFGSAGERTGFFPKWLVSAPSAIPYESNV
eukprot:m.92810 g.92810  ORF g.92810 m.92810 type:complete len:766 (-) comp15076_c0_seq1:310-2607(-)